MKFIKLLFTIIFITLLNNIIMAQEFDRTDPNGFDEYFMDCIGRGDMEAALACFDPEALYVEKSGNALSGIDAIRKAIEPLVKLKAKMHVYEYTNLPVTKDLMYRMDKWTVKATLPDGSPLEMKGASVHLLRRNAEGYWMWLVDSPFTLEWFKAESK